MNLNFKSFLNKIDNYLLPNYCIICHRAGSILCPACRVKIKTLNSHCPLCGKKSLLGFICSACHHKKNNLYFDAVFALSKYEEKKIKIILTTLKNKGLSSLAIIIGRLLAKHLANEWHRYSLKNKNEEVVIMPIFPHKKDLRKKGFNPQKIIAQELARIYLWPLDYNLKRHSYRKTFSYSSAIDLSSKTIILIDKLFKTGTTANTASYILKQAGAKKIIVVVIAKDI